MRATWMRLGGVLVIAMLAGLLGSQWRALEVPGRTTNVVASQNGLTCASWRSGSGMMGAGGMMGGQGGQWSMGTLWGTMGTMGMMGAYDANSQPISDATARQKLDAYAASCGNGVKVDDFTTFASTDYGSLVDAAGKGYLEVVIDRFTGAVYPEPQSMMWNTNSGMHLSQGAVRYDQAAAQQLATTFLARYLPGAQVVDATAFPGYYTFDFGGTKDHPVGMLSVNASSGQIWVHSWHGPALPS